MRSRRTRRPPGSSVRTPKSGCHAAVRDSAGHHSTSPCLWAQYMPVGQEQGCSSTRLTPLLDTVVAFMDGRDAWEGTASELLSTLEPLTSGLPADGTRLSKELFGLASQLAARGIGIERLPRARQRGIRLVRR